MFDDRKSNSNKYDNKRKGDLGEKIAEKYLKKKGFEIIEKNYKTPIGEIDIIAIFEKTLIFVEVKSRYNDDFGMPAEAVTPQKVRKISQNASLYIKKHRLFYNEARFDVVEVYLGSNEINHIENAFESYLGY